MGEQIYHQKVIQKDRNVQYAILNCDVTCVLGSGRHPLDLL